MTTTQTAPPATPAEACSLEGPCGICAVLSPAARAALAETLSAELGDVQPLDGPRASYWIEAIQEQEALVESAALTLAEAGTVTEVAERPLSDAEAAAITDRWRSHCTAVLQVEAAKLAGLRAAVGVA